MDNFVSNFLRFLTVENNNIRCKLCHGSTYIHARRVKIVYRESFILFFLRQKADRPAPKHRRQFTTWQVFRQVERRFHSRDSNHQPLPWDLGIPLPSPGSLRSSRTRNHLYWVYNNLVRCYFLFPESWPRVGFSNILIEKCCRDSTWIALFMKFEGTFYLHADDRGQRLTNPILCLILARHSFTQCYACWLHVPNSTPFTPIGVVHMILTHHTNSSHCHNLSPTPFFRGEYQMFRTRDRKSNKNSEFEYSWVEWIYTSLSYHYYTENINAYKLKSLCVDINK